MATILQDVAVKRLRGSAAITTTTFEQEGLLRELRVGQGIRHDNLVQYYGMWEDLSGRHCLVMEFLGGGTLHHALIGKGPLAWDVRVGWYVQVCSWLTLLLHCDDLERSAMIDGIVNDVAQIPNVLYAALS